MAKTIHTFDFCFQVVAESDDFGDITPAELRKHLVERAMRLDDAELEEACGVVDAFPLDE